MHSTESRHPYRLSKHLTRATDTQIHSTYHQRLSSIDMQGLHKTENATKVDDTTKSF